ncbi:hypothetical protein CPB84DRAFT_1678981 [Gymnopilus junonius]|uniref:DUF6534 domain-containing protein n=1 Tax=Gymnopilus junonius TaxID=109634 RepID=A0A9P5NPI6_GYMJU|nr:hypothetical protein CPB84DRAFT_1678981 [Gymnopilus junonius]
MEVGDLPGTYGAILLGALVSAFLSGTFAVQCTIYFKFYPRDGKSMKGLVSCFKTLELVHTGLIWASMWSYFVANFGRVNTSSSFLPFKAVLTFLTHWLVWMSERNLYLTVPVPLGGRCMLSAMDCSFFAHKIRRIHLGSYPSFRKHFRWLFSMGLGLSSALDILITFSMFFLLRNTRRQSIMLHSIIDSLILYAFEIGTLTSAATVASMLCWVLIDNSLIFLGLHFVVGKLYANSLLATSVISGIYGTDRGV